MVTLDTIFYDELIDSLKKCAVRKYPNVLQLHLLLSSILRVVSSQQQVNHSELNFFKKNVYCS